MQSEKAKQDASPPARRVRALLIKAQSGRVLTDLLVLSRYALYFSEGFV